VRVADGQKRLFVVRNEGGWLAAVSAGPLTKHYDSTVGQKSSAKF